jgi:hypothetical protein
MDYNQIVCGGIWHATSVTKCVASKMISIIVAIVPILPIKQQLGKNNVQFCNKYLLFRILQFDCFFFFRYWFRFQISDHTTSTTCTIFYDETKRLLKIIMSELLDLVQGNNDEVPKVIQELYAKIFIFRFKLNKRNLTEGRRGYLVTRTFISDDMLWKKT